MKKFIVLTMFLAFYLFTEAAKKPNVLFIWGDNIGQSNISAYSMGFGWV